MKLRKKILTSLIVLILVMTVFVGVSDSFTACKETKSVTVQLLDNSGNGLEGGVVKYYSHGWKSFGTTNSKGRVTINLQSGKYKFSMSYNGETVNKYQHIGSNPVVTFKLVKVTVKLLDSKDNGIKEGEVNYFANGWKDFGETDNNGEVQKELFEKTYKFKMIYADASINKYQDVSIDPVVEFKTKLVTIKLLSSNGKWLKDLFISLKLVLDGSSTQNPEKIIDELEKVLNEIQSNNDLYIQFKTLLQTCKQYLDQNVNIPKDTIDSLNGTLQKLLLMDGLTPGLKKLLLDFKAVVDSGFSVSPGTIVDSLVSILDKLMINGTLLKEFKDLLLKYKQLIKSKTETIPETIINGLKCILEKLLGISLLFQGIKGAEVSYYPDGWNNFGITDEFGEAKKELLPKEYQFKMSYEGRTIKKRQDVSLNPFVEFFTIKVTVKFLDSFDNGIEGGIVEYCASGWKNFGITDEFGESKKELLPNNYCFKMNYDETKVIKNQDIRFNPVVEFETVLVTVKLLDCSDTGLKGGTVEYLTNGWKSFGTTDENGKVKKEMLPKVYRFKMSYDGMRVKKKQDVSLDSVVEFQTTLVTVKLLDSSESGLEGGIVEYRASGWKSFGTTDENGEAKKELLPTIYRFKLTYKGKKYLKTQDVSLDPVVIFKLELIVLVTVKLLDSSNNGLAGNTVEYYDGSWKSFGIIDTNGEAKKALLSSTYTFKVTYGYASNEKIQNIGTNPIILFQTMEVTVELRDHTNNLMDSGDVEYDSGGWHTFGTTSGGQVSKELLPNTYIFKMTYEYASIEKSQDVGTTPTVVFKTTYVKINLSTDYVGIDLAGFSVQYYSGDWRDFGTTSGRALFKELLPNTYNFKMIYEYTTDEKVVAISGYAKLVTFKAANITIVLKNHNSNTIYTDSATVQYYSDDWHDLGTTKNGVISNKFLLPGTYKFKMTYQYTTKEISQYVAGGKKTIITFQTGQVKSGGGHGGCTHYYSAGSWRSFTNDMQLFPGTYNFKYSDSTEKAFIITAGIVNNID